MSKSLSIITVTLNTASDRVLQADNFTVGSHTRATQLLRYPAGKGINVSRTLARLGWMSVATGFVGQQHADEFEQSLRDAEPGSIRNQLLTVPGSTRENITIIDTANNSDTHIRTEGYTINSHNLGRITTKIGLLARPESILVFSGSLPEGIDLADFYTLVNIAFSAGSRVILDIDGHALRHILNIDSSQSSPSQPAQKICYMAKPNQQELADLLNLPSFNTFDEILNAARLLATRVEWVVVTLGSDGAILIDPQGNAYKGHVDINPDQIINTVGCGDTMLAGLIDAQMRNLPADQLLRSALAIATANAAQIGVAEYDLSQVQSLVEETIITPIAS
ncbi:Tagatose-6-phosphate kinase [Poriferisphaera corsica]|uniref:Tagatose-6-phosphate kinase n=1 Tax=Poriferisphaera corsica TaxID=2528020 RepID=A0A517YUV2_9BACT|nr:1-phosphofructokinase family hexose kinase [Poriferisphaera corsica]QDU34029.1 Tagatose-6-phosphate kinase [Poriferisphaera corsica]